MDYLLTLKNATAYLESHLYDDPSYLDVAKEVYLSPFHFMRIFKAWTGYTIEEYTRKRKLYIAALSLINSSKTITEIAFDAGYSTLESFSKAFKICYGVSPSYFRKHPSCIEKFEPLEIIFPKGGNTMDFKISKMPAFRIVGFKKEFDVETAYKKIPEFWDEVMRIICSPKDKNHDLQKRCGIGQFGVCVSKKGCTKFDYYIAGLYHGEALPKGYEVYEIGPHEYAKFKCIGPMPKALQELNTKIYKEWLPTNKEYEMEGDIDIEYYSLGDGSSSTYESGIWLPIQRKSR